MFRFICFPENLMKFSDLRDKYFLKIKKNICVIMQIYSLILVIFNNLDYNVYVKNKNLLK